MKPKGKRLWTKTETVEHDDIARRKRIAAIYAKQRKGAAQTRKENDE